MMCDDCNARPATVRYAEMVDGRLSTWNLCDECAREKGVGGSLTPFAGPLVSILKGLLADGEERGDDASAAVCPQCDLSYVEFRRVGRLGCETCYDTFREDLKPLLRRVHGSTTHAGGVPANLERGFESRREVRRLRSELDLAVRREEYERAAELRDAIRAKEEESSRDAIRAKEEESESPEDSQAARGGFRPPERPHVDVRNDDE